MVRVKVRVSSWNELASDWTLSIDTIDLLTLTQTKCKSVETPYLFVGLIIYAERTERWTVSLWFSGRCHWILSERRRVYREESIYTKAPIFSRARY